MPAGSLGRGKCHCNLTERPRHQTLWCHERAWHRRGPSGNGVTYRKGKSLVHRGKMTLIVALLRDFSAVQQMPSVVSERDVQRLACLLVRRKVEGQLAPGPCYRLRRNFAPLLRHMTSSHHMR